MKNLLVLEQLRRIKRRKNKREKYDPLGTELKTKRINKDITLEAAARKICSLSYLSKLENNKIEPNFSILRELCERQNITEDDINKLYESGVEIENALALMIKGKVNEIEEYLNTLNFENYRIDLIKMIFHLAKKDYDLALVDYEKLICVCKTMLDDDFIVFSLLCGFLDMATYRFVEAINDVINLNYYKLSEHKEMARNLILFMSLSIIGNIDSITYYNKLERYFYNTLDVELMNNVRYFLGIYYIKSNSLINFNNYIKLISNKKHQESLMLMQALVNKDYYTISNYKENDLLKEAKLIYYYVTDRNRFKEEVSKIDSRFYDFVLDPLLLNYLVLDNNDDKYQYINDVMVPSLVNSKDKTLLDFVLKELTTITTNRNIYKLFTYLCENKFFDIKVGTFDEL